MNLCNRTVAAVVACLILAYSQSAARADFGVPISAPAPLNSNASSDTESDRRPALATDGLGHWVAVWSSRTIVNGTASDDEIFVARSIDNGEHWSNPVPLNSNFATDSANDSEPQIATDRQGHWVAVWESLDQVGSTLGNDNDILVARSGDNGATWTTPAPLNNYAATDSSLDAGPRIAADGQGHWVTVWYSDNSLGNTIGTDLDILFARSIDNGETWANAAPLAANAATDAGGDANPFIVMNDQGVCVAAWSSNDTLGNTIGSDQDILVVRSLDGGEHWSLPIPLNANAAGDSASDFGPRLALDEQGHCVAVWESSAIPAMRVISAYIVTARSLDNGASWSLPAPLNGDFAGTSGRGTSPTIAADDQGRYVAAWLNYNSAAPSDQQFALLVVRSGDNGANWSSPSALVSNGNNDNDAFPVLVSDHHGTWVAVWQSADALGAGFGGDVDAIVARFALPDCNNNLIADSTETLLGLLPDINFNNVPDLCEIIEGPPPGQNGGCGAGLCGAGAPTIAPLTMLGFAWLRRSSRRRLSNR